MRVSHVLTGLAVISQFAGGPLMAQTSVKVPTIVGEWWGVAGDPDLGPEITTERQQPVDFAVWQAADGTWQLWSCVRGTNCGGNRRLFHGWEGKQITDASWTPTGIQMTARPELGETTGGLQAPHVVKWRGEYWMAYGDWENICFAKSKDGKKFERVLTADGRSGRFSEGPGNNTRDAMLLLVGDLWHCYYTAYPNRQGMVYCRTSPNLLDWSESVVAAYGGEAGTNAYSSECPHVVALGPDDYYLFRTQRYGWEQITRVYHSRDPKYFGVNQDDKYLVCSLPVAAPEIVFHEGQYYIAALRPDLKGISIARLDWK
ncbi:hypothetical protein HS125_15765 [bacterium]|nr:hypothetical protein [bacterium]